MARFTYPRHLRNAPLVWANMFAMRRPHWLLLTIVLACGNSPVAREPSAPRLRAKVGGVLPFRTLAGDARYVPVVNREDEQTLGGALEGGERALVGTVRLIELQNGGVLSATTLLPGLPAATDGTTEIPSRMGGGFLFHIGASLYRADDWLAPVQLIFTSPTSPSANISRVVVGLDRVYVQLDKGAYVAIDPKTGAQLDLGTFPRAPFVTSLVTLDGWRAAAIADTRGVVVTEDAGATWTPVNLGADPIELSKVGDAIVVKATDNGRDAWFVVSTDGHIGRLADEPEADETATAETTDAPTASPFGTRPLVAAIEDGWPLTDGSALVARDGAIGRVRLSDGALVEIAQDVFPLKPARCHPFSLARASSPAAIGFACGEPRGATEIYAYDPTGGFVILLRHFDNARLVASSGNGAIWIRGGCATDAPSDDVTPGRQSYCLLGHDNVFTDFFVQGELGTQRIVVLADGRRVVISPPQGKLAEARITILDKGVARTLPIQWEDGLQATVQLGQNDTVELEATQRVLRNGTWLESFEERKPGKLSGWVAAGTVMMGIEIGLDGRAKHGPLVRDMGAPIVSSAYGLGWASRHGYETVDGGMTWRAIDVPDPLARAGHREVSRACGPIGCETAGWLRVGWGTAHAPNFQALPSFVSAGAPSYVPMHLQCELTGKLASPGQASALAPSQHSHDWYSLYGVNPPKLTDDEYGWGLQGPSMLTGTNDTARNRRLGDSNVRVLAYYYAWGPRSSSIDWTLKGRATARWSSPFEASSTIHSTQLGAIPKFIADPVSPIVSTSRMGGVLDAGGVAFGEDGDHALWVFAKRNGTDSVGALLLEADRGATEIRRADGVEMAPIDSAVRAGGRWYLATANDSEDSSAAVVWEVESGVAHELTRLPRVTVPPQWQQATITTGVRMARRAAGRAVGVIVDGQPSARCFVANQRWVIPIDLASGKVLEPEPLGPFDIANAATICDAGAGGWVLDASYTNSFTIGTDSMSANVARIHYDHGSACVERVVSTSELDPLVLSKHLSLEGPMLNLTALTGGQRVMLRCAQSR